MKITIYTVSDCKFSAEEKTYLQSKGMQFEEKNLETNRDFLTEMLAKSNNFAGTPVTEIVKDDGTSMVIKGFTQSEFDAALNGTNVATTTPAQDTSQQTPATDPNMPPAQPPVSEPTMPTTPPVEEPQIPQTTEAASAMSIPDPVPASDPTPAQPIPEPVTPSTPPVPDMPPAAPVGSDDTLAEAHSGITAPPTDPAQPATPDVTPGQVLSENTVAPITIPTMTATTEPMSPATMEPQGGPVVDPALNMGGTPTAVMPTDPAQPSNQPPNPLNSVLSDLQAKATS